MICSLRAKSTIKVKCDGASHSVIEVWNSSAFMYYSFCHWQALNSSDNSSSGTFKYSYQSWRRAQHEDWSEVADSFCGCRGGKTRDIFFACTHSLSH